MFAISEIDPKVGILEAHYIQRQVTKKEIKVPIQLVKCEELLPGGRHEGQSNNVQFDINKVTDRYQGNYLCPLNISEVSLTGGFRSEQFNYFKISLKGCQLKDGSCLSDNEISEEQISFIMLKTTPNVLGEHKSEMVEYS